MTCVGRRFLHRRTAWCLSVKEAGGLHKSKTDDGNWFSGDFWKWKRRIKFITISSFSFNLIKNQKNIGQLFVGYHEFKMFFVIWFYLNYSLLLIISWKMKSHIDWWLIPRASVSRIPSFWRSDAARRSCCFCTLNTATSINIIELLATTRHAQWAAWSWGYSVVLHTA